MPGKKVVVLGGGFGGVRAAITARRLLPPDYEVTLLDRRRRTYICGSMPLLIVGEKEALKASRSLGQISNRGVNYVETEVERVDTQRRSVKTRAGEFPFDFLVMALGAEYDWDAVPNSRAGHSFYDLATAQRLRNALSGLKRGRIIVAVASTPYKCPPAPFEGAMMMRWASRNRGVEAAVQIDLYTPEPAPIPVAGPEASACVAADLTRSGITLHANAAVKELAKDGQSASFTDGSSADADLIVTVPVHRMARVAAESGIAGGKPWIQVNPQTLETSIPGIYAIGDVNVVPMANGRPLPKAGIFASTEGEVVAQDIAAKVAGGPKPTFTGEGYCFIAYSGKEAGRVSGQFLAADRPRVEFEQPSQKGFRAKERFEQDWRRFRL